VHQAGRDLHAYEVKRLLAELRHSQAAARQRD
jgi:hypothetical protein